MLPLIQDNQQAIADLCKKHHVDRLELFGSAADGTLTPDSDLDFLIQFDRSSDLSPFDQYFGLLLALNNLLGRDIDLIEPATVTNPFMLKAIQRSPKQVIYDAA